MTKSTTASVRGRVEPVQRRRRAAGTATAGISAEMLELIGRYLQERVDRRTLMESTTKAYRNSLHVLGRVLGDRPVSAIDAAVVEAFLDEYAGMAAGTIRAAVARAQGFSKWLVRQGLLDADPFYDVDKPRLPRYMPRALGSDQVKAVFESCTNPRDRLIVSLMVNEGLRCVEVARVQFGDVDFRDRMMRITGKGMHERVLPITDETWSCLQMYLEDVDLIGGPLIRQLRFTDNGVNAQYVSEHIAQLMKDAGIKRRKYDRVSAHALRHTAATDMLRNGAHVRDVQNILGHANLQNTQVYMPLVVRDLREAMNGRSYRHPELGRRESQR